MGLFDIFKKKKVFALFLSLAILASLMCACQTKQAENGQSTNATSNTDEVNAIPQWKTAYLDFLQTKKDTHLSYALVYIDNDDIPELYLSGNDQATGDSICAYKNGAVVEQPLHRIGGGWYVEKSGYVVNKNGHMGQEHTHTYKLNEVGFELTFEALSSERISDEYVLYLEYSIWDKTVTEAEYNTAIKDNDAETNFENAVRLNKNQVEYDLIRQQIMEHG